MISTTIIQDLIIYFARFVPVRVRKEMLKQPQNARFAGYEEVKADILNVSEVQVLPDFDSFVVSVNNKLVSDRVKNSRNFNTCHLCILASDPGLYPVYNSNKANLNSLIFICRPSNSSNFTIVRINCFVLKSSHADGKTIFLRFPCISIIPP